MNCKQCNNNFTIYKEDKEFYQKFEIPEPQLCPDCRSQRRLSYRNENNLYAGTCGLCKQNIISQYSLDKDLTVYCRDCWWSDKWEPYDYAQDYDFSRPFFDQYKEFIRKVPQLNLLDMKSDNSAYTHCVSNNRNCYLIFTADYNENSMYSNWLEHCRECVDCLNQHNSEQTYESFFGARLYNSQYLLKCFSATDSFFCYDCRGIQNCVLSTNLRNKQYNILNKQYSKEEYEQKLKELALDTYSGRMAALQKFKKILKTDAIHHYRNQLGRIETSSGDYLRDVRNCFECFDLSDSDNCRHVRNMIDMKDSMDCEFGGEGEEGYQNIETFPMPRYAMCTYGCYGGNDIMYSHTVMNSKYVFGSSGIRKGEYVIFNKKYSAEEYQSMITKIKDHMMETGEWGEFFPNEDSFFAYNETNAQHWFPLSKEEIINQGWNWFDPEVITPDNVIPADELSETIKEVKDDIIKSAIACVECSKAFRIVKQELDFYRQLNIPLPRMCYSCRFAERRKWHNPWQLENRQCMCEEKDHGHKKQGQQLPGRCETKFETSYLSGRDEIIYCSECYNFSVY
ncbi:MAG: zinc-ribbon domain containing protein [bacterium]|nr:zinc-ribbon domain containing protein [bacterium]